MQSNFCFVGKDKLKKWEENKGFRHVFEPPIKPHAEGAQFEGKGRWNEMAFPKAQPITLELGCGKGEYTVGLGALYPERNFVGVDIKGHRFWRGAKTSHEQEMTNVAFLRARIEFIHHYFGEAEVDQIWLTFSDPQPKEEKHRITGPKFVEYYKKMLRPGGIIHIKTDNTGLFDWTLEALQEAGYSIDLHTHDVYGDFFEGLDEEWKKILSIRTYYETKFMETGSKIKYLRFRPDGL